MRWIFLAPPVFVSSAMACTGISLTAKDGSIVHGRTAEFGVELPLTAVVIPRGYTFPSTGLAYTSKYGVVGISAYDPSILLDGLNEQGLAVGTFYFPGYAEYAPSSTPKEKSLSPIEFPNWILTQFASVDEVKEAVKSVAIVGTVLAGWGNAPPPFHYIITDKKGKSIVIEPLKGTLIVHDNPLGILTNSPTFDWHMTNLRSYINLSPFNVKPVDIGGVQLAPFGQGSGMVGLPGDFSPPSRFVRAALFSTTAIPSPTAKEAIFQAFHILNQFDIPIGIVRSNEGGVVQTDQTLATAVRDPQALRYYFRTYKDQTIHVIDLKSFDLSAKELKRFTPTSEETAIDISAKMGP
jgi:choloylglycine hydrolase